MPVTATESKVARTWTERPSAAQVNDLKKTYTMGKKEGAWVLGMSTRRFEDMLRRGEVPGARLIAKRWHINTRIFFEWLEGVA